MKITIDFNEKDYVENSAASKFLTDLNKSLKRFMENKEEKTRTTFEYKHTLLMVIRFYELERVMPPNLNTVKSKLTKLIKTFGLYPVQSYLYYLLTHQMRDIAKNVKYFPTLEYGTDLFEKYNKICAAIERNKLVCESYPRLLLPQDVESFKISFINGKRVFQP